MPNLKLEKKEVVVLMRSLLRSLEKTPTSERVAHERVYEKLSAAFISGLPKKLTGAIGRAIDVLIGR